MEVHHHTKTPRQKFSHYFWEFFMLFLAITLGFFVENRREHFVEHQREKVYMKMLVADLQRDTMEMNRVNDLRLLREEKLRKLIALLGQADLKAHAAAIYRLADTTDNYESFLRNDRTIQQLKTAGGMRMIRKDSASAAIMEYDNFIISEVDWNNRTEASRIDYYKQLRFQLFDAQSLFKISNRDTTAKHSFISATPAVVNAITGAVFQVLRISETCRETGHIAKQKAVYLLSLIKRQYHFN